MPESNPRWNTCMESTGEVGVWMIMALSASSICAYTGLSSFLDDKTCFINCVPLLFPKSFRVFSWVICCIWCTKDQELIIVLKSGLISNPDQNGTRHNQNGTRQKVGTFMKIRRSPVSSDVRKAWRHNQTTGMKRFLELWTQLCIDLI